MSANGLPIKIIANELGLSERTVEKHRANIMAKANAKNMIEAIICIQHKNATEYSELNFQFLIDESNRGTLITLLVFEIVNV